MFYAFGIELVPCGTYKSHEWLDDSEGKIQSMKAPPKDTGVVSAQMDAVGSGGKS